jgi:hypothetical protein
MADTVTIVVKCLSTHPPTFEVLYVNESLISEENLRVGEILSETDLDFLFDAYNDFGVEVLYR